MNTNKTNYVLVTLAAIGLAACASKQPTPHLVDARRAYDQARNGVANEYVPDEVYQAKVALDAAERAHGSKPGSEKERHLAYVAHRKAMVATASGQGRMATAEQEKAAAARERILLTQRDQSMGALEQSREDLEQSQADLTHEKDARTSAEATAAAALASLGEMASVKAEDQRVVITLSGEVLFKTNEATLLPIAQNRLDKVAEVLKDAGDGKQIVIAGHTDSRGTADYNSELSRKRAEAVRSYLVGKGVPEEMIGAIGKGENEPIADNRSAEGRANNRRVEIIIDEAAKTSRR